MTAAQKELLFAFVKLVPLGALGAFACGLGGIIFRRRLFFEIVFWTAALCAVSTALFQLGSLRMRFCFLLALALGASLYLLCLHSYVLSFCKKIHSRIAKKTAKIRDRANAKTAPMRLFLQKKYLLLKNRTKYLFSLSKRSKTVYNRYNKYFLPKGRNQWSKSKAENKNEPPSTREPPSF